MDRKIYLLVEWLDKKSCLNSKYSIMSMDLAVFRIKRYQPGSKMYTSRKRYPRKEGIVVKISEDENLLQEHKYRLQRQDNQIRSIVSMCLDTFRQVEDSTLESFVNSREPVAGPSRYNTHPNVRNTSDSDEDMSLNQSSTSTSSDDKLQLIRAAMNANLVHESQNELASEMCDMATQTAQHIKGEQEVKVDTLRGKLDRLWDEFLIMTGQKPDYDGTYAARFRVPLPRDATMQEAPVELPEEQPRERPRRLPRGRSQQAAPEPRDVADEQLAENAEVVAERPSANQSNKRNGTGSRVNRQRNGVSEPGPSRGRSSTPRKVLRAKRVSGQSTNTEEPMVDLGEGNARIPLSVWNNIPWNSYKTATRHLLDAVFTKEVLATSSLTGKPSPAFTDRPRPPKKALDPLKVEDIVKTVTERLGVSVAEVRGVITVKCSDETKMQRKREGKTSLSTNSDAENQLPSPISSLTNTEGSEE